MAKNTAILLISCLDRPGIVANVSNFLYENGANIINSDQYSTDPQEGMFFMRVEFYLSNLAENKGRLIHKFKEIANKYEMNWDLCDASEKPRAAIFVSKEDHCLLELLWQWKAGDLDCDLAMVISNHETLRETAESFNVPFYYLPVSPANKAAVEHEQLRLLKEHDIEVVVLAKYMQIVSKNFITEYQNKIINIHHSFLPAFVGAKPYERAYERGVKIIGATAHYVTEELDAGPIIEQDIARITHAYSANELKKEGRLVERSVLVRAFRWHLQHRIIVFGNKTVVFK